MARIKGEEVKGFRIGGELVCPNCILPLEGANLEPGDLITANEIDEEDYYFCDRGRERIL